MIAKIGHRLIDTLEPKGKPYEARDTELKGFLVRIQPNGAKTYYCDLRRPNGLRGRIKLGSTTALTPAQARDEALKILADKACGKDPIQERTRQVVPTLSEFLNERYTPHADSTFKRRGKETLVSLRRRFADFLNLRLNAVTSWHVEQWRHRRLKAGIHPATVNRNLSMIRSVFSRAIDWGVIETHPMARTKACRVDRNPSVRYLSAEEDRRLMVALNEREERLRNERDSFNDWRRKRNLPLLPDLRKAAFADHLKPLVIVSLNTGLRQGELFQLKRVNINFSTSSLSVEGAFSKSGHTRHIPLNQEAKHCLGAWLNQTQDDSDLVFPSRNGKAFDNVKRAWTGVLRAAKIENFRWHDLRHSFASNLVMRDVSLNTIRELLGHSDLKITLRYAHLAPKVMADAVERLTIGRHFA